MLTPVAIVDDDPEFAQGIRALLESSKRFQCVALCSTAEEALRLLPSMNPRVILMDMGLPGLSGPACVAQLAPQLPKSDFMMLTVFEDYDHVFEALTAGATGYLLKGAAGNELLTAIDELLLGGSPMSGAIARRVVLSFRKMKPPGPSLEVLTQREEEILNALARGRRPKEIAQDTGLSFHTVRTHQQNIYKKLQVCSRREAVNHLHRWG